MEYKPIKAPRGTTLSCKGWHQEAALRMLQNNLDEEVAENPQELIIYGGSGKAARNWECYYAIVDALKNLENDETLLVQSGKPVGIFKTHSYAPRVLISNSMMVPAWANWEKFRELEKLGLIMFGQMTAGSWIYIGTQGILQGTYETFASVAKKHFIGDLKGKFVLTGGMGGMGGAQPLAVTMNGGTVLCVEVDKKRIERRLSKGYCDKMVESLDEALDIVLKEERLPVIREKIAALFNRSNLPDELKKSLTDYFSTPEMVFEVKTDPADYLAKVKCPILALGGSNDMAVPAKENHEALRQIMAKLGRSNYEIVEFPNMNHFFQTTTNGMFYYVPQIEETMSPVAMKTMGDWILKTTRKRTNQK